MDISTVQTQIHRLKELLSLPSTDVVWTNYNSPSEIITDLELLEKGILNNEIASVERLLFLLAPTSDLQEISISSGWGHEFLSIVELLENALDKT